MPNRQDRRRREKELQALQRDGKRLGVNWAALKLTAQRSPATIDTCFEAVADGLRDVPMLPNSARQRIVAAYELALAETDALGKAEAKAAAAAKRAPFGLRR